MAKNNRKDHKVEIWTTDGKKETKRVTAEESSYYDQVPFTSSSNVQATRITKK